MRSPGTAKDCNIRARALCVPLVMMTRSAGGGVLKRHESQDAPAARSVQLPAERFSLIRDPKSQSMASLLNVWLTAPSITAEVGGNALVRSIGWSDVSIPYPW